MKPQVFDHEIATDIRDGIEYICITDIARHKNAERTDDLFRNGLCNRNTIEFLGIREQLNNPDFKPVEFDGFKKQAGLNSFTLTPKQWVEQTAAIGGRTRWINRPFSLEKALGKRYNQSRLARL